MTKTAVTTGRIAPPVGPFSPAILVDETLYLSGQVAQDPASGRLVAGDVGRQTEQTSPTRLRCSRRRGRPSPTWSGSVCS